MLKLLSLLLVLNPNGGSSKSSIMDVRRHAERFSFLGQIYLSNRALWNPNGVTVAGWANGTNGPLSSQLFHPLDLAVSNDRLFIADQRNNRFVSVSLNDSNQENNILSMSQPRGMSLVGETLYILRNTFIIEKMSLNDSNSTFFQFHGAPVASYLFVDNANDFYLSSMSNHTVTRFHHNNWTNGEIVAGTGRNGARENELDRPYGIFVDDMGSLYIADCHNNRIMVWLKNSNSGIIAAGNGSPGNEMNQLWGPTQVIVDSHGYMYISEAGTHRITRWAFGFPYGVCLVGCKGPGLRSDQLRIPHSLAFDKHGTLYVNDWGSHRIQKFQILNYTGQLLKLFLL